MGLPTPPSPRDQFINDYSLRGSSTAQVLLALMILNGRYEKRERSEGLFWLSRASASGNKQANVHLARFYLEGELVGENWKKAELLLMEAAEENIPKAQWMLGMVYLSDDFEGYDYDLGVEWLRKAHKQGFEEASTTLNELKESENL